MTTLGYTVVGMTCEHCVRSVTDEISKLDGVTGVVVSLGSGRVTIEADHLLDDGSVAAAVEEAGYRVAS